MKTISKVFYKTLNIHKFHTDYLEVNETIKNPCFEPLFESPLYSLIQVQVPVENFLKVG